MRVGVIGNLADTLIRFRGPLIRDMAASGVRVFALSPSYDSAQRERVRAMGAVPVTYSLDRVGLNPLRDACDTIALVRTLRRLRLDATLSYFIKPVIYASIAARLAGVDRRCALIEGAGSVFSDARPDRLRARAVRTLASVLYRVGLSQTARVFLLNADDERLFVGRRLVSADKVVRLNGIGVDLSAYRPTPPVLSPPTFVMAARLLREKGVAEFAAAARIVKRTFPQTRFVLLGGIDPNPDACREEDVRGWVDDGVLDWPGHVDDVRPWLAGASVFVLPSYYREGVPRSTMEAMAMARPVVTTDWVGCRETVTHGRNGFRVPVRDAEALAAALQRFVEHPALIAWMGDESRRLAEARFDVRTANARILQGMGITRSAHA